MIKSDKNIATYRRLRTQPYWRLLAADHGPIIIGLLQTHLYENARSLPASLLYERITHDLDTLRAQGGDYSQTAQTYIAAWLAEGYLVRRFPTGATEEEYELSTATVEVIRFLSGLIQPHSSATESRLTLVIEALVRLAEDTDTDKSRRIERLLAEQARIDKEIQTIHTGQLHVLSQTSALERTREIIMLADELTGDFRRVRDELEQLNRTLRENIIDHEGSRGETLNSLFAGMDLLSESDAGRSFSAFWRLLTDAEQGATLNQALDNIMARDFVAQLDARERQFLRKLTRNLLEQGGMVHDVMQSFARSLKTFVQSREYLEQRRLNQLLKSALSTALSLKEEIKITESLEYTLTLTSSRLRSFSQWVLHDPSLQAAPEQMQTGDSLSIDMESISELLSQSEIDFRALKTNILAVLQKQSQASIGEVLEHYPATQGLGSIAGLMALGSRHGYKSSTRETVNWVGVDDQERSACIAKIFFIKDRAHELV